MTNKKFRLGMLVMVLVFGMAVVGCDNGTGGGGSGNNGTISGGTNYLSLYDDWSTATPSEAVLAAGGITEEQFNQIRDAGGAGGFFGWRLSYSLELLELVWTGRSEAHFNSLVIFLVHRLGWDYISRGIDAGGHYVSGRRYSIDFNPSRLELYDPQIGIFYLPAGTMILYLSRY